MTGGRGAGVAREKGPRLVHHFILNKGQLKSSWLLLKKKKILAHPRLILVVLLIFAKFSESKLKLNLTHTF